MTFSVKELLRNLVDNLPDDCDWRQFHYRLYITKKIDAGLRDVEAGRGHSVEEVQEMAKQWRREWEENSERRFVCVESREKLIDHLYRIRDRLLDRDPTAEVNDSTDRYLEALSAWLDVCDGYYRSVSRPNEVEQASWQLFADALESAISYE